MLHDGRKVLSSGNNAQIVMNLIDHIGEPLANLKVIREVLNSTPGAAEVGLSESAGVVTLKWHGDDERGHRSVRVCLPLSWMSDPGRRDQIEVAARNVASGVERADPRGPRQSFSGS